MPPVTTQQEPEYAALVRIKYPKGGSVTPPSFGPGLVTLTPDTSHADYDLARYLWNNSTAISRVMLAPTASDPGSGSLPTGAGTVRKAFVASSDEILYDSFEVASSTGVIATHVGRGIFDFTIDPGWRAGYPEGQAVNATVTVRARKRQKSSEYLTWAPLTISTTGSAVSTAIPPTVVGQPAARSFNEGVASTFSVNVASFFSVDAAALPATYTVENSDGTTLSGGWTLNSIISGVASITSPSSGTTSKTVVFRVTDANSKTASVSIVYPIVANPLPQVVSAITAVSIDISQSGNFPVSGASVIVDPLGEALTYSLRNADGTAPASGYSYDGSNIAYPTEGGAVTRSFIIRAVETGALGRTVDSAAFTFDRPALPVTVVDPVATVSFPENATTSIDVDVRTALSTDAAEDITIPATFTGKISKSALGSGVFRLTGTFANNEILSATATYSGTASGSPVTGFPTFKSVHNPPVDGVGSSIDLLTNTSSVLDVVALSDDPSTNLIVAGSAFIDVGQVSISADFKTLTLTPLNTLNATATLTYILEAGSGGPQTAVSIAINWRQIAGPQPLVSSFSTQSTDGVTPPTYDLTGYWVDGDLARDLTSIQFYDIDDTPLGATLGVSGSGTMTISSAGIATLTQVAGFVGVIPFRVGISDTAGNFSVIDWSHTQLANPGDPPPPGTIVPNTLDGKPIIQYGIETPHYWSGIAAHFKNARQIVPLAAQGAGSGGMYSTNLKTAFIKIQDAEHDTTTGWLKLAPGEFTQFYHPRWYQSGGDPSLNQGDWEVDIDVMTGGTATITMQGWTETGSTSGNSGGQSALINSGTAFTFDRKRYVRNLTSSDTWQAQYSIQNSTGADIWVRYWYGGLVSNFSGWEAQPFTSQGISDFAEQKVLRIMDPCAPGARAAYADDMIRKGDFICFGDGLTWSSRLSANNFYRRTGTDIHMWAKACILSGTALWFCVPMTFGMGVTDGLADGFYTASAQANFNTTANLAYRAMVSANFDSIVAAAKVEFRAYAQRCIQDLIDAGYPDDYIVYIELSNEIWNTQVPLQQRYSFAIEEHIKNRTDGKPKLGAASNGAGGAGYIHNLMSTEFAQVISEMKPNQQHQFVVGVQTPSVNWGDRFCLGWNVFSQEFPSRSLPVDRAGLATTNYWSGAFNWNNNRSPGSGNPFGAATEAEFVASWQASYAVSLQNLENDIVAWYINPNSTNSSIYGQMRFIDNNVATAAKFGCKYIGSYEGSFHEDTSSSATQAGGLLGFTVGINTLNSIRNSILLGTGGEAITSRAIQEFVARYPGKICANYYKYARSGSFGSNSAWFEKTLSEFGSVPTTGAAKAWYDNSRQGAGAVTPPTNLDQDFETATTQTLISTGWTFGSFDLFDDGFGDRSLYSTNEFDTARQTLGSTLQANAIRSVRVVIRPDGARTAEYGRLIMSSTGDYVAMKPGASGALILTHLGQGAANAVTTSGLDLLDGNSHDLTITHYAHASAGLIEVKRTSDDFVYGTFSGDTLATVTPGASPHIDTIELRGKVWWGRVANLTGVTPPTPQTEWETTVTLAYSAGIEAGFVWDIDLTQLTGGAAHEFFQKAQADGGDIRAYLSDKTTRLPLDILSFSKTAGTGRLRVRTPSSMSVGATIKLKTGGDGTLTQPAPDAQYGREEVYQDFDLYTTDMLTNRATSEVFGLQGGAAVAGPNGLQARGYDSQGVNAGDASTSTLTTNDTAISCGILFFRSAKGGGGVGVSDTGFARMFHMQNGDDVYIIDSNGALVVDREFSTTDATWYTTYGTKNTWAGFCYSHDGSTGNPTFTLNGANAAVSVLTAPVGTLVPGTTSLIMGNHNGFNRNWDGRLCEYWRRSATTTQAFHIAWQTQMLGLSTFVTYDTGQAW